MNRTMLGLITLVVCAAISAGFMVVSHAADVPSDRPSFVAQEFWVPVAPGVGMVVDTAEGVAESNMKQRVALQNGVSGYFMVRRNGLWRRLEIEQQAKVRALH